ncbi:hypothetical protein GCM10010191_52470 [Actinomadura vinacea]|uniref:Radical SAM protein n=1 Tax=Actinomadura vinacea TaxID=115336 RepID=A0ABN3JJ87_9ACTN
MTITTDRTVEQAKPRMLWLDLTRKCQLSCSHCYNSSGPEGDHGTMTIKDWTRVLDEAAGCGVQQIQLIGGEPTMHPAGAQLVEHALGLSLRVEIYTNLVHVSAEWWGLFQRDGVSLATSYYSDQAEVHNAVTGRPTHARTRANIERALTLDIPLRAGIIDTGDGQSVQEAWRDLEALGVTQIGIDRVRRFGRGADGHAPDMTQLCGNCGTDRAAIGPNGEVSPCVFTSDWMSVGNVHRDPLAAIVGGTAMAEANASIRGTARSGVCEPDQECKPGTPGSGCSPKA